MTSRVEELLAQSLRAALARAEIGEALDHADEVRDTLGALEWYLLQVLEERHAYWKHERLDGVLCTKLTKTAPASAELLGICILISDQTIVPANVRLRVSEISDEVEWLECRIGERGNDAGGMIRHPYDQSIQRQIYEVSRNINAIDWAYAVTFGEPDTDERRNRRMQAYFTRDSVCAADDVDAPHSRSIKIPATVTLQQLVQLVSQAARLPSISGGKATWSLSSRVPLAVIAQQWAAPVILNHPPGPALSELDWDDDVVRLHFTYFAQQSPDSVLAVLRDLRLRALDFDRRQ